MVDRPVIKTQTIEDFMIQIGSSAIDKVNKNIVDEVNTNLASNDLRNIIFSATGIEGSTTLTSKGETVFQQTVLALVDPNAYSKAFSEEMGIANYSRISTNDLEFLQSQGIKANTGVRGVLYFSPESLSTPLYGERVALHEIGHGLSEASRAYSKEVDQRFVKFHDLAESVKGSTEVSPSQAKEIIDEATHGIIAMGHEEGRAEAFSYEAIQRRLKNVGTTREDLRLLPQKIQPAGYLDLGGFEVYLGFFEDRLKPILTTMGDSVASLESPLTGKTRLTVGELMADFSLNARALATTAFGNALTSVSGEVGEGLSEVVSQSRAVLAYGMWDVSDPDKISAVEKRVRESADMKSSLVNRTVKIESAAEHSAAISSQPPRESARRLYTRDSIESPRMLKRTKNILETSTEVSASVAKRNSRSMQVAGAITTVMKKRLF